MNFEELEKQLIVDEDERLKLYKCPAGKWTIGVGHNIEDLGISHNAAMYILSEDISRVIGELDKAFPWWSSLSNNRQLVLANMCFNMGIARLSKFVNFLSALRTGFFDVAAAEMVASAWYKQTGDRAKRLVKLMIEG